MSILSLVGLLSYRVWLNESNSLDRGANMSQVHWRDCKQVSINGEDCKHMYHSLECTANTRWAYLRQLTKIKFIWEDSTHEPGLIEKSRNDKWLWVNVITCEYRSQHMSKCYNTKTHMHTDINGIKIKSIKISLNSINEATKFK